MSTKGCYDKTGGIASSIARSFVYASNKGKPFKGEPKKTKTEKLYGKKPANRFEQW